MTKKYYWIKLKDSFMTSDAVDFLMGQQNGAEYVVLYQMLCLKTANTGGRLESKIGEVIIPYDAPKIQRDLKYFCFDTVTNAIALYGKLGLMYQEHDGCLCIANHKELVGVETKWAEKKRLQRKKNEGQSGGQNGGKIGGQGRDIVPQKKEDIVRQEKEIERDKEIDIISLSFSQTDNVIDRLMSKDVSEILKSIDFCLSHEESMYDTGQMRQLRDICKRVARTKSDIKINDTKVPPLDVLKTLCGMLQQSAYDTNIKDALENINQNTQITNRFSYTLTTLYNLAKGF